MADNRRMKCEDMILFIFEWVILNPEAGSGIKYIRNLNKSDLKKVCLYIDGKISKDAIMEVIIARKNYLQETSKQREIKKKNQ